MREKKKPRAEALASRNHEMAYSNPNSHPSRHATGRCTRVRRLGRTRKGSLDVESLTYDASPSQAKMALTSNVATNVACCLEFGRSNLLSFAQLEFLF